MESASARSRPPSSRRRRPSPRAVRSASTHASAPGDPRRCRSPRSEARGAMVDPDARSRLASRAPGLERLAAHPGRATARSARAPAGCRRPRSGRRRRRRFGGHASRGLRQGSVARPRPRVRQPLRAHRAPQRLPLATARDLRVGDARCKREVSRPRPEVVDELGGVAVRRAAASRCHAEVHGGTEQRVGEADDLVAADAIAPADTAASISVPAPRRRAPREQRLRRAIQRRNDSSRGRACSGSA